MLNGEINKHDWSSNVENTEPADIMRTIWMGVVVNYPQPDHVNIQWAELADSNDVKTWILRDGKTELLALGCIVGEPVIQPTDQYVYYKKKVVFTVHCSI